MAQDFSRKFYNKEQWKRARRLLIADRYGLCEMCRKAGRYEPGIIGHHIQPLTPANINDPQIAYGLSNLMLLCNECHERIHNRRVCGTEFDINGQPIPPIDLEN